ncbi:origin recognition complex subunit 3-like [Liolophura sinensis]|uniref:origin recognition complex subunit 3-like n=1 Tax=Liolophura sinensis TaxID=3198878 RepID=UPI003159108B
MATTGSVTKGCFVFKTTKRKIAKPDDYFVPEIKAPASYRRKKLFQEIWEDINNKVQILQSEMNSRIFDDLLEFIKTSGSRLHQASSPGGQQRPALNEIPTAALITGVNTPDHAVMFSNLTQMVREKVSPYVTVLRAKDCSNIKTMLTKTVGQFMNMASLDSDDEDGIGPGKVPCSIDVLAEWYAEKQQCQHSPSKKKRTSSPDSAPSSSPPLVIVLEDLESFTPQVLQDFLIICSNHLHHLPVVMVFGIATTVTAVHRLLPNAVSSLLCMEKFQAAPSTDYLTQIINQLFLTDRYPFKLGAKVFQFLLDAFLFHDFSVLNFTRGFHFAMMDHFYSNPVSCLCCPLEAVDKQMKQMTHEELEEIRQTNSFMRYVEGQPPSKQADLLTDDKYTKQVVTELIQEIFKYNQNYYPMLRCIHAMVSELPRHPLGKQIRELYALNLDDDLCNMENYNEAKELMRMLSRDELMGKLCCFCLFLSESTNLTAELVSVKDGVQDFIHQLEDIGNQPDIEDIEAEESEPKSLPTKTKLYELRQTLQDLGKKKKLSPYEKLRNQIIDYIDSLVKKYLVCPSSLPLWEIFYYNRVSEVKQHLSAAPRVAIQTALSNPHHYLQCECCSSERGGVLSSMPDVCIVYKLHLECGQLINLFDWLQAFVTVITPLEDDEDSEKQEIDPVLQARFIRAVSELQFLGFIKPTKRKTDHVARLTWGGC